MSVRDNDAELAEIVESGSREEVARALAPAVSGILARRFLSRPPSLKLRTAGSKALAKDARERAAAELPATMMGLLSSRRKFKGGSVRAWILKTLRERGTGPAEGTPQEAARQDEAESGSPDVPVGLPPDAEPEELARHPELPAAVAGLLAGLETDRRDALVLVAVEGLSAREAGGVLGEPAAVVEQRASRAFAELARKPA